RRRTRTSASRTMSTSAPEVIPATQPRPAAALILMFQRHLLLDGGQVGVLVTLVGHFRRFHSGSGEMETPGRRGEVLPGPEADQPGALGNDGVALAVLVELGDRHSLIVHLRHLETGWGQVERVVEGADQADAGGLDLQAELALVGLALVEDLRNLQFAERA